MYKRLPTKETQYGASGAIWCVEGSAQTHRVGCVISRSTDRQAVADEVDAIRCVVAKP